MLRNLFFKSKIDKRIEELVQKFNYGAEKFGNRHTEHTCIDTIPNHGFTDSQIKCALLLNAIENNPKTKTLDHILFSLRQIKRPKFAGGFRLLEPLSPEIFTNILYRLHSETPMSFTERAVMHEILPAFRLFSNYCAPRTWMSGINQAPKGLHFAPIKEQIIAKEYDDLHKKEGCPGAQDTMQFLIAKREIWEKAYPDASFRLGSVDMLLDVDQYAFYIERRAPTTTGSIHL